MHAHSGFESTMRAGPLARKIVASDIAQGIDYMYYSPNRRYFPRQPIKVTKTDSTLRVGIPEQHSSAGELQLHGAA